MLFKKTKLNNGLRVITVPMQGTQTVTVMIMVGIGSRYETESRAGLSHFIEHMLFKGSKKYPNALAISETLDAVGGEFNAFTSKDKTAYYAKVDAQHFDTALDVLSDMFLHSKFEQVEIDREKGSIIQELEMYLDRPSRKVWDVFDELMFGKNPLGRDIIGYKNTINSFARKDFIAFLKKNYGAQNVLVSVAGNINEKKVISKIENHFSSMNGSGRPKYSRVKISQDAPRVKLQFKKTDQTHLIIGHSAYDEFHPDRYALSLLSVILGGNMSSRLFIEVRERRGLAYSVRTSVDAYRDCGYVATQVGVAHKNVQVTIETILAEFEKIKKELVSEKELQKAKDYIRGKLVMDFEASDEVALFHGEQEIAKDRIISIEELLAHFEKVTPADLQRVAQDVFTKDRLNLAIVGPHKNEKALEKLLSA